MIQTPVRPKGRKFTIHLFLLEQNTMASFVPKGRSPWHANKVARKSVASRYERALAAVRSSFNLQEVITHSLLCSRLPENFSVTRPHQANDFLQEAKKKGHLLEDGRLAPWEKIVEDQPDLNPPKLPNHVEGKVISAEDDHIYRRALYTEGEPFLRWTKFSASTLPKLRPSFAGCDPASIGSFLARIRDEREPGSKAPPLVKNGDWALTDEGLRVQKRFRQMVAEAVIDVSVPPPHPFPESSPVGVYEDAGPGGGIVAVPDGEGGPKLEAPPLDPTPEPPAAETLYTKKPRVVAGSPTKAATRKEMTYQFPEVGDGPIPVGKAFTTKDRRCLGMLILALVEAGGMGVMTPLKKIIPHARTTCQLGDGVKGNIIGRFYGILFKLDLVDSWEAEAADSGYLYKVCREVYQRVLDGEFGELPLDRFTLPESELDQPAPDEAACDVSFNVTDPPGHTQDEPGLPLESDATLDELAQARRAMEALQEQIRGLPEQLQDIVSEALRRQAEDFERRLADAHAKHAEELSSRDEALAHLGARLGRSEADLCSVGELEERMAHMESQFGALTAFKKLLMAFAEQVK